MNIIERIKKINIKEFIINNKKLTSICVVSVCFLLFVNLFFEFLLTNLRPVNAYTIASSVQYYSEEVKEINYGHCEQLAEIGKDVLKNKVSIVNKPIVLSNNFKNCIYQIDDYVVEFVFSNGITLGENEIEIHVKNKETYYNDDENLVVLYCRDRNADIVYGVECIYKAKVNVVDKDAPRIYLNKTSVTLSEEDTFNPASYLASIYDNFDGVIYSYRIKNNTLGKNGDLYIGNHRVIYECSDSSGNVSSVTLPVKVNKKVVKKVFKQVAETPYAGSIVAEAYKYLNAPYVWGANGPYAFDCSGFVQFIYKKAGIYVPRTSGSQGNYGAEINPYDRSCWRPGDILTFGPGGNQHAGIYVGNGKIIHALNPDVGVIVTNVDYHIQHDGLYSVRRP